MIRNENIVSTCQAKPRSWPVDAPGSSSLLEEAKAAFAATPRKKSKIGPLGFRHHSTSAKRLPMYVLETRGLKKNYGAEGEVCVHALRGVNLQVRKGELLAIMGPSGSGKSTLLHILGGVETPSSGQVLLEGVDLATLNDDQRTIIRRERMGFIFQSFNLLPAFTAEENVALPWSWAERRRRKPAAAPPIRSGWWAWRIAAVMCRARCRAANSSG